MTSVRREGGQFFRESYGLLATGYTAPATSPQNPGTLDDPDRHPSGERQECAHDR